MTTMPHSATGIYWLTAHWAAEASAAAMLLAVAPDLPMSLGLRLSCLGAAVLGSVASFAFRAGKDEDYNRRYELFRTSTSVAMGIMLAPFAFQIVEWFQFCLTADMQVAITAMVSFFGWSLFEVLEIDGLNRFKKRIKGKCDV